MTKSGTIWSLFITAIYREDERTDGPAQKEIEKNDCSYDTFYLRLELKRGRDIITDQSCTEE